MNIKLLPTHEFLFYIFNCINNITNKTFKYIIKLPVRKVRDGSNINYHYCGKSNIILIDVSAYTQIESCFLHFPRYEYGQKLVKFTNGPTLYKYYDELSVQVSPIIVSLKSL